MSAPEEQKEASGSDEATDVDSVFIKDEGIDWLLASLISHSDNFGTSWKITLTVGGRFITGELISGRTYFEEMSEIVKNAGFGIIADSLSRFSGIYPEPHTGGGEPPPFSKPTYIHLRRARMVGMNGNYIPASGALWRGKLGSVEGFSFGELVVVSDD